MLHRRAATCAALLVLTGCPIRTGRVQRLLDVDWFGEACSAASVLGDPVADARVIRAHSKQAPVFSMRVLPPEPWGGAAADASYGRDWAVLEATFDVRSAPAPELDGWVELVEPGQDGPRQWQVCPPETCDAAWVADHLGVATPPQRDLWSTVGTLTRLVAVPFTLMVDLVTTAAQPRKAEAGALGPPLTFRALEPIGQPPATGALPPVWSAPMCGGVGPCVRRWVAVAAPAERGREPGVSARITWRHEACETEAVWRFELPTGADLRARLAALGAVDLSRTPAAAGRLHDP